MYSPAILKRVGFETILKKSFYLTFHLSFPSSIHLLYTAFSLTQFYHPNNLVLNSQETCKINSRGRAAIRENSSRGCAIRESNETVLRLYLTNRGRISYNEGNLIWKHLLGIAGDCKATFLNGNLIWKHLLGIVGDSKATFLNELILLMRTEHGRVRGMGRGMTITKLSLFQTHNKYVSQMENRIKQLENIVSALGKNKVHQSEEVDKTSSKGGNSNFGPDCKLVDWGGTNEIVAEGRVVSFDPKDLVDQIPLGPNAIKVLVNVPIQPNAFLWRPTPNMTFIKEARGKTIAWHSERVILQSDEESGEEENYNFVASIDAKNKCKLLDWNGKDEVVAEGRLHSSDPNALVNGIPLGPNAMIVSVDVPKFSEACLWRPLAADMRFIKDVSILQ